jgi:hypothetical protein
MMLIDDFLTGPHTVTLAAGGNANYQSITTNPDFPVRSTWFFIASSPSNQPGTFDVGSTQRLTVGTGPHVYHQLQVAYGYQIDGRPSPLDRDLSKFTGFRLSFDFNDLTLNFNILFYSDSGATYSQAAQNIGAKGFVPFSADFPFAQFVGAANPSHVDFIALLAQTGSFGGGNDYKINSFEVY